MDGLANETGKCLAGYYCSANATSSNPVGQTYGDACPAGHYCPEGSQAPIGKAKIYFLFVYCFPTDLGNGPNPRLFIYIFNEKNTIVLPIFAIFWKKNLKCYLFYGNTSYFHENSIFKM